MKYVLTLILLLAPIAAVLAGTDGKGPRSVPVADGPALIMLSVLVAGFAARYFISRNKK